MDAPLRHAVRHSTRVPGQGCIPGTPAALRGSVITETPRIGILTITRENREGLERTIASVASQSLPPFEFIVHDGNSTDGTQSFLVGQRCISRWDSSSDRGIADALNLVASQARADWLLFLNAGDCLADDKVLADVAAHLADLPEDTGVCFGDALVMDSDGSVLGVRRGRFPEHRADNTICHQAAFIRRDLQLANPYDHRLRIGMDYDLWYRLRSQTSFAKMDRTICRYALGGLSSSRSWAEHSIIAHHMVDWLNQPARKLEARDVVGLLAEIAQFRAKKALELLCGPSLYGNLKRWRKR